MKTIHWVLIGGGVLLLGGGIYVLVAKPSWIFGDKEEDKDTLPPDSGSGTIPDNTSVFPLKYGSKGSSVYTLQKYLNKRYNAGLKEDGDFGGGTLTALKNNEGVETVSNSLFAKISMWSGTGSNTNQSSFKKGDVLYSSKSNIVILRFNGVTYDTVTIPNKGTILGTFVELKSNRINYKDNQYRNCSTDKDNVTLSKY